MACPASAETAGPSEISATWRDIPLTRLRSHGEQPGGHLDHRRAWWRRHRVRTLPWRARRSEWQPRQSLLPTDPQAPSNAGEVRVLTSRLRQHRAGESVVPSARPSGVLGVDLFPKWLDSQSAFSSRPRIGYNEPPFSPSLGYLEAVQLSLQAVMKCHQGRAGGCRHPKWEYPCLYSIITFLT